MKAEELPDAQQVDLHILRSNSVRQSYWSRRTVRSSCAEREEPRSI